MAGVTGRGAPRNNPHVVFDICLEQKAFDMHAILILQQ